MAMIPDNTSAFNGVGLGVFVPLFVVDPSWPRAFVPKPHTVPSPRNAKLKNAPAAMAVTPVRPATTVGVGFAPPGLLELPSSPF